MRRTLAVVAFVASCGSDDFRECASPSDCLQSGVTGECLASPVSTKMWCAFDDDQCPTTELRWGILSGDGLAATCVAPAPVDAGIDSGMPTDAAPDASGPRWGSPEIVAVDGSEPSVTADDLELFFNGGALDVWTRSRTVATMPFGPASEVPPPISSAVLEFEPEISANGLELFYVRAGDIFRATRTTRATAWSAPSELFANAASPSLSAGDLDIYYLSGGTIYRRTRPALDQPFGVAASVPLPSTLDGNYTSISMSDDGLHLIVGETSVPTIPELVELTRPSLTGAWTYEPVLDEFMPPFKSCDFVPGSSDAMYCGGENTSSYFDIYLIRRQ